MTANRLYTPPWNLKRHGQRGTTFSIATPGTSYPSATGNREQSTGSFHGKNRSAPGRQSVLHKIVPCIPTCLPTHTIPNVRRREQHAVFSKSECGVTEAVERRSLTAVRSRGGTAHCGKTSYCSGNGSEAYGNNLWPS